MQVFLNSAVAFVLNPSIALKMWDLGIVSEWIVLIVLFVNNSFISWSPNNVWSVFIGITWGDVSCEVSEMNENRKPIIVSRMKGSLVSFCQVSKKKKKKNEAALLLVTLTFNWRIKFSITRCICGKNVAQRIYTFCRGNEWGIIFTSFGSL